MFSYVLVIDDDPVFCELLKTYAQEAGAKRVYSALNGRDALGTLQQNFGQIDFIVLDLNMPNTDGIELLDKIKDLSFAGSIAIVSSETPVVINMAATLGQQYGLNIVDAVKKPLSKEVVDRWFGKQTVVEDGQKRFPE